MSPGEHVWKGEGNHVKGDAPDYNPRAGDQGTTSYFYTLVIFTLCNYTGRGRGLIVEQLLCIES